MGLESHNGYCEGLGESHCGQWVVNIVMIIDGENPAKYVLRLDFIARSITCARTKKVRDGHRIEFEETEKSHGHMARIYEWRTTRAKRPRVVS